MTFRTACAMLALFCASPLVATPTPPTPAQIVARKVASLTALLTLTSGQQTAATTIFTNEETALATIRPSLDTLRTALTTAIEANDTATIASDASQIGSLTTLEVQDRAQADAAFYALLTTDQQTRYKQLMQVGGPGGFGGPGGGRPGPH